MADRRDDLTGVDRAVSDALDALNARMHNTIRGWVFPVEFRELLRERGYVVVAIGPSADAVALGADDLAGQVARDQQARASAAEPMSEELLTILRGAVWIATDERGEDVAGCPAPAWMLRCALTEVDRLRLAGGDGRG